MNDGILLLFCVGADLDLMDKISSPRMTRFMTVLMSWDCRKTFLGESMHMVNQIMLQVLLFVQCKMMMYYMSVRLALG